MAEPVPLFKTVAVIGLGLIGGSVAAAARASGLAGRVVGFAPGDDGLQALRLGLIDTLAVSAADAASLADLVVVATPVSTMPAVFDEIAPVLPAHAIVTDCGSTKRSIVAAARDRLGAHFARFLPGHPISGSEFSGPGAARADLFTGKLWLFSPVEPAHETLVAPLSQLVTSFGAVVQRVDNALHDELFAEYSHAPHALVFAICQAVADGPNAQRLSELAGAGFKDTTRIGASSPQLWSDILLDNREGVIQAMDRYMQSMQQMRDTLEKNDRAALVGQITRGSAWRASLK